MTNTSVIYEISSEQPLLSADEKLLYIASGFQGLFIINVTDFDNPFKISQLVLIGVGQQMSLIYDEKYLLMSESEQR